MKLYIHLGTNIEYFKLLNEGALLSQGKQDRDIAQFFSEHFPGELAESISPQYEVNYLSLKEIKRKLGKDAFQKIEGIYYGSDNCEYLAAYKKDIEAAMECFVEFNKNYPPHAIRSFTLVTPYVGDTMLGHLEQTLEYLNDLKIKNSIEVVINDLGVLRLVTTKYTNLKPIFGRVIHKLLKTPLIDTYGYEVHPSGENIKNKSEQEKEVLRQEIIKWQLRFYNSTEVSLEVYRSFLKKFGIERVTLDAMEKREKLFDNKRFGQTSPQPSPQGEGEATDFSVGIDVYYPWALIFTGRLCDTSAIENPARGYYAVDDICPRTCNRYDIGYKIKTSGYKMIQRGNAGYRSELSLDCFSEEFMKNQNNRLVYAPFVTV